jgi:hypothetical protein
MATTGAVIARIVSQYSDKGSKEAQRDIAKMGKKIDAFGKKATKAFAAAGVATVAFAGKLAVDAVQGAMEDQKAQASLAVALRNTTGATEDAIAANSRFLDSLELQVAIDNDELIPALKTLVQGTGNLSKAQGLLALATDISAASGKDLGSVSMALSKAYNGQFGALTKLGLPLSAATIKAKDFTKAQEELAKITKGQAEAAANTFAGKLTGLRLRFNQLADGVGYALIPVLEKFVDRLENEVFPALEKFIRLNQQEIADTLAGTITVIENFGKAAVNLASAIESLSPLLKFFASGIASTLLAIKLFTGVKVVAGILKGFGRTVFLAGKEMKQFGGEGAYMKEALPTLAKGIRGLTVLVNSFRVALGMAAVTGAAAFGPILAMLAIAAAAVFAVYKGMQWLLDKSAKRDVKRDAEKRQRIQREIDANAALAASYDSLEVKKQKAFDKQKAQQDIILSQFKSIEDAVKDANATRIKNAQDAAREARMNAEQLADEQKRLYIQGLERKGAKQLATLNRNLLTDKKKMEVQLAAIKKNNAKLDKQGIKLTDPDEMNAIQMEAIYQNLLKTGKVLLAETTKQQKALDDLKQKAADEYNKTLLRQADIVQHLDKLRANDIVVIGYLANKWEMTTEAADMYIKSVLAIGEVKLDDAGILAIRMAWGMSGDQAKKYLEFTAAIKAGHGNIGKEKLEELGRKWFKDSDNPTEAALHYSQALDALADQQVGADEVNKLAEAWNTTPDKVAAYLLEVGKPFTLTDDAKLILSAEMVGKIAGQWDKARLALEAYLNAAKGFTLPNTSGTPSTGNPSATGCPAGTALVNGKCTPIVTIPPKVADPVLGGSRTDSAAAAAAYAAAKAAGDLTGAALAAAGVTPSALAAGESGAIGAASIAAQLRAAEAAQRAADAAAKQASSLAAFKAKEAADLAASQAASAQMDYDERFRFRSFSAPTADPPPSPSPTPKTSDLKITIDATGDELSTAIRNSLLFSQSNGNQITLQAI